MASTAQFSLTSLSSCHSAASGTRGCKTHAVVSFPSPIRCPIGNNSLKRLQLSIPVVDSGRCAGRGDGDGGGGGHHDGNFERIVSGVLVPILNGFISWVAADPQFPFKVLMEELVNDKTSRPNFGLNELGLFFSKLLDGAFLNFTLRRMLGLTVESSSSILSHLFEPGIRKSVGVDLYKKTGSTAGTALPKGLMKMWKKPPPTLLNNIGGHGDGRVWCGGRGGGVPGRGVGTEGSGGGGEGGGVGGGGEGGGVGGGGGKGNGNWSRDGNFEDSLFFSLVMKFLGLLLKRLASRNPQFLFKDLSEELVSVRASHGGMALGLNYFILNGLGLVFSTLIVAHVLKFTVSYLFAPPTSGTFPSFVAPTNVKQIGSTYLERLGTVVYRGTYVAAVWFAVQIALSKGMIKPGFKIPKWVEVDFGLLSGLCFCLFAVTFCFFS